MSSIAMQGGATGSGTVTLLAPVTNTNRTINLPDSNGTVLTTATAGVPVNGPAFSGYNSGSQAIGSATFTKVQINTETFDTNNNFDPTTNYRFTPTVAGYYQINGSVAYSTVGTNNIAAIYKNGVEINRGNQGSVTQVVVSCLVNMNGSSDYLELYGYSTLAATISAGSPYTYFQAAMVRSAT